MTWVLCLAGNSMGGLITDLVSPYGECLVPHPVKTRGLAAACNSTVTFASGTLGQLRWGAGSGGVQVGSSPHPSQGSLSF